MQQPKISFAAGAVGLAGLPEKVRAFAEALSARHGAVHVSREKNGLHLNMACPKCLETEGDRELQKRHLAVNADKACATGAWGGGKFATMDRDRVAKCMKCEKVFSMHKLLRWKTLEERGIKASVVGRISVADNTAWLVQDARGNVIPGGPGQVTPVHQLSPQHPAVHYLATRNFTDREALYAQMRVSFCEKEWAEDSAAGRFYRRIHYLGNQGFKDTPQGRLIFYCDIEGVQKSWQARVLEHVEGDVKYYLHPYTGLWTAVEQRVDGKFKLAACLTNPAKSYDSPAKYRTANGTERNAVLFGYDAAVRWNAEHRPGKAPLVFLVEGPLDACRLGAPAVAQIGKFLSDAQVELLAKRFSRAILIPDNDKAGQDSKDDSFKRLSRKMQAKIWDLPMQFKDVGEMSPQEAQAGVQEHLTTN